MGVPAASSRVRTLLWSHCLFHSEEECAFSSALLLRVSKETFQGPYGTDFGRAFILISFDLQFLLPSSNVYLDLRMLDPRIVYGAWYLERTEEGVG